MISSYLARLLADAHFHLNANCSRAFKNKTPAVPRVTPLRSPRVRAAAAECRAECAIEFILHYRVSSLGKPSARGDR